MKAKIINSVDDLHNPVVDISEIHLDDILRLDNFPQTANITDKIAFINKYLFEKTKDRSVQAITKNNQIIITKLENYEILKRRVVVLTIDGIPIPFGSAPEFTKDYNHKYGLYPEMTIIPDQTYSRGINYGEVEFTIYSNYFLDHKKQKLQIVCSPEKKQRLDENIKSTLFGPDYQQLIADEEQKLAAISKLHFLQRHEIKNKIRILKVLAVERRFFEIFDDNGKILSNVSDFVDWKTFDKQNNGRAELELKTGKKIYIEQSKTVSEGLFTVFDANNDILATIDLRGVEEIEHGFTVGKRPLNRYHVGMHVISTGTGFSANKKTTSFIFWLEGKPYVWDPMAYTKDYLKRKGLGTEAIKGFGYSHDHADHDQGGYNYVWDAKKACYISTDIVLDMILKKTANNLNKKLEEVKDRLDTINLEYNKRQKWPGANTIKYKVEYGLHSIPSIMIKFYNKHTSIGYSGDTLYDKKKFQEFLDIIKNEIKSGTSSVSRQTYKDLVKAFKRRNKFFKDVDVIFHEAGEDHYIHTTRAEFRKDHPGKRIFWGHIDRKRSTKYTAEKREQTLRDYYNFFMETPNSTLR